MPSTISGSLGGASASGVQITCYSPQTGLIMGAADSSGKAVQVVHLSDHALPELASYNSVSGPARGLRYDAARDRLFVLTRKGFLIFQPGITPVRCP